MRAKRFVKLVRENDVIDDERPLFLVFLEICECFPREHVILVVHPFHRLFSRLAQLRFLLFFTKFSNDFVLLVFRKGAKQDEDVVYEFDAVVIDRE